MPQTGDKPFDLSKATPGERKAYHAGYQAAILAMEALTGNQYRDVDRPEILDYKFDAHGRIAPVLMRQGIETLEQLRQTPDSALREFLTLEEINAVRMISEQLSEAPADTS